VVKSQDESNLRQRDAAANRTFERPLFSKANRRK
jgi:hypothetical protein